jgi:hypothetical protein
LATSSVVGRGIATSGGTGAGGPGGTAGPRPMPIPPPIIPPPRPPGIAPPLLPAAPAGAAGLGCATHIAAANIITQTASVRIVLFLINNLLSRKFNAFYIYLKSAIRILFDPAF